MKKEIVTLQKKIIVVDPNAKTMVAGDEVRGISFVYFFFSLLYFFTLM
jgi:hypothetical protein